MNERNAAINDGLKKAMAALFFLEESGCVVAKVESSGRNPVITLKTPAPSAMFLTGAFKKRERFGGIQVVTLAARVHGCQVEWLEAHAVAPEAQRA